MNRIAKRIIAVYVKGLGNFPQGIHADYPWRDSPTSYNGNAPYGYEARIKALEKELEQDPDNVALKRNIEQIKAKYEQKLREDTEEVQQILEHEREKFEAQKEELMAQMQEYQYQLDNATLSSDAKKIARKLNRVKKDLEKLVREYQLDHPSYIDEDIY